jgi:short-subunit dehydrogenase
MLVNNAGITMWANFEDVRDISFYEQIMRVNYLGSVYCTYYALPFLKKTKGQIVAISSLAGKNGLPKRIGYAASKPR